MRKVLLFALTIALALGGLGYAHAAVTDSQDELLIYPILETGDPAAVAGRTVSMTFACGDHLRWYTDHTFGGGTETQFLYTPEAIVEPYAYQAGFEVYLSGGMGSSVSGGEFSPANSDYGAMLKAVAVTAGPNERKTMNLRMADYVPYYLPDFDLNYMEGGRLCEQHMSLHSLLAGESWYDTPAMYEDFFRRFKFPVQEDQIVTVTVEKNDVGQIVGIDLYPENGPMLYYVSDVNAEGIWFVPVFRSEDGKPLAYESPEGHGLYFAPWKQIGTIGRNNESYTTVTPDMQRLERVISLDENTELEDMVIDADAGRAWLLSLEETEYVLTEFDLTSGEARSLPVLPHDSETDWSSSGILRDNGFLLLTVQERLALVDEDSLQLLLTADDDVNQDYFANRYDPDKSDLSWEDGMLVLTNPCSYRGGAFWIAAYRQGGQVYYGEYDCSLMRGNDDSYYRMITTEQDRIMLK